jgi:hypothetical protein
MRVRSEGVEAMGIHYSLIGTVVFGAMVTRGQ